MTIDGVRVLAQEAMVETPNFVFIIAILLTCCAVGFGIATIISNKDWVAIVFNICISIAFLWVIIVGICGIFDKPSNRNTYKCIFDKDVSIQEIYDEYEVVGRDGEIWILEDKR